MKNAKHSSYNYSAGKLRLLDRTEYRVSDESTWTDFIWRFKHDTAGQGTISIGWQFQLPDGTLSTDDQHTLLLRSFQEVFWGLLNNTGHYGKALSIGSIPRIAVGIRELFRWMVFRGYRYLSELDNSAQQRYLFDIPILLGNPVEFYSASASSLGLATTLDSDISLEDEDDNEDNETDFPSDDGGKTYATVEYRVMTLYYVHSQLHTLKEQGIPGIEGPPFDGKKTKDVVNQVTEFTVRRIPPLPDEVALPLLSAAIARVRHVGEDVICLQSLVIARKNDCMAAGVTRDETYRQINDVITGFDFQIVPGESKPWRERITKVVVDTPFRGSSTLLPTQVLRREIMRTMAACVIVLQYLTGLRISEVCSIQSSLNNEDELPPCIGLKLSKSGLMEVFKLRAQLSKGVPIPEEELWAIGARPVGSSHLPLTVKALSVLERLFKPWRALAGNSDLIVSFSNPRALPLSASSIGKIRTSQVLREVKSFVYYEVDLSKLPDTNSRGEDLSIYRDTKGLCIRTHQGRKTFSAYVLETRSSLIRAVSEHFKHLSVSTTENAYFSHPQKYKAERENIVYGETTAYFVSILTGMRITGKIAALVDKYFTEAGFKNIDDVAELERKVQQVVYMHDLRIFFADHGKCFIKSRPLESRCNEAAGGASWHKVAPNFAARSPGMCSGCGCFAVDASNLKYWKEREKELTGVVAQATAAGVGAEYRVLKARAEQAKKVVESIERAVYGKP